MGQNQRVADQVGALEDIQGRILRRSEVLTNSRRRAESVERKQRRCKDTRDVLAIDPGPTQSGWVLIHQGRVAYAGTSDNSRMLEIVQAGAADCMAIEQIESYGMRVGSEVFETCVWIGRFMQAWRDPDSVILVPRRKVKTALGLPPRSGDADVRAALLRIVGGKGCKAEPGPTYLVKSHAWAALGVAVAVQSA